MSRRSTKQRRAARHRHEEHPAWLLRQTEDAVTALYVVCARIPYRAMLRAGWRPAINADLWLRA